MSFSYTTYMSPDFGGIVSPGPARVIAGLESRPGRVPIAWTASFTSFETRPDRNETHALAMPRRPTGLRSTGLRGTPLDPHDGHRG